MTTRFHCSACRHPLEADDRYAGATLKCPKCGQAVTVPAAAPKRTTKRPTIPAAIGDETTQEEPVGFKKETADEEEVDMTPMIDCVFLLLIFFLVTAAFSLQKSLEMPTPDRQEKNARAKTLEELLADEDLVVVRIDKDNTIWVNDAEAPSEPDLWAKLRHAREAPPGSSRPGPSSLLVLADGEARHETVVMVLDAGNAVGMESVRLATVDEEDF